MRIRGGNTRDPVPEAIQRYHRLALIPDALPHPLEILRSVSQETSAAYNEAIRLRRIRDEQNGAACYPVALLEAEEARRKYLAMLAQDVMNENPLVIQTRGGGKKSTEAIR